MVMSIPANDEEPDVSELIAGLERKRAKLWVEDGELKYNAPVGVVTADLLVKLRQRRAEIIDYLQSTDSSIPSKTPVPIESSLTANEAIQEATVGNEFPAAKELRLEVQREITTYLSRSLPLSVILTYKKFYPWFYGRFIQLFSHVDPKGIMELNFLEPYDCFEEIADNICLGYNFLKNEKSILEFTLDKINLGYYIIINLDEYHIKEKMHYQTQHFVHPSLIYGYDSTKRTFSAIGFNASFLFEKITITYDEFVKAYEDSKLYYKEYAWWAEWSAIQLIKPSDFEEEYPFEINRFIEALDAYLSSTGDSFKLYAMEVSPKGVQYGIEVYDVLVRCLEAALLGKGFADYRAFHLLYEHKKGLYDRLAFVNARYGASQHLLDLHREYSEVVEFFNTLRMTVLKFFSRHMGNSFEAIKVEGLQDFIGNIVESVMEGKHKEIMILGKVLDQLKKEFSGAKKNGGR